MQMTNSQVRTCSCNRATRPNPARDAYVGRAPDPCCYSFVVVRLLIGPGKTSILLLKAAKATTVGLINACKELPQQTLWQAV